MATIYDCALPTRLRNALDAAGVVHLEQIRLMSDRELLYLPSIGPMSLADLRRIVAYQPRPFVAPVDVIRAVVREELTTVPRLRRVE